MVTLQEQVRRAQINRKLDDLIRQERWGRYRSAIGPLALFMVGLVGALWLRSIWWGALILLILPPLWFIGLAISKRREIMAKMRGEE